MTAIELHRIDEVVTSVEARHWRFAETRAADIATNWAQLRVEKPRLFDGRVLVCCRTDESLEDGRRVHRSHWFETAYSAFVAWRDFGYPDRDVRNGFAMAALRGSDGGYVLARMGEHTANAGHIYFACGTPDPGDVRGTTLDLEGSAIRELMEETDLRRDEFTVEAGWTLVAAGPRLAFLKDVRVDMPARDLARDIELRLASQADPELAGMHVVRSRADLRPDLMPDFILAYLDRMLPAEDQPR